MLISHPGKRYIEKRGSIQSAEDVFGFADFLLTEAGVASVLPIDLNTIYAHFGIPKPKYVPLSQQQGLLVDADRGIIIVNANDPETRQRFTEAHELVEMLFSILPSEIDLGAGWRLYKPGGFKESIKEYLCNRTAANLLMPPGMMYRYIQQYGVSFGCAQIVATDCQVSLSAALVQLAQLGSGRHSIVLWRMKNKPKEIKNQPATSQLKLFNDDTGALPAKKLRVEWAFRAKDGPFIPENKSTETSSLIYAAWQNGTFTSGAEKLSFDGRGAGLYRTENLSFEHDNERYVLSLIEHLPR